jgi:hypothetical protein
MACKTMEQPHYNEAANVNLAQISTVAFQFGMPAQNLQLTYNS